MFGSFVKGWVVSLLCFEKMEGYMFMDEAS